MDDDPTRIGERCKVCDKPFTPEEWANRHTDPDDGVSDIHAHCCRWCHS